MKYVIRRANREDVKNIVDLASRMVKYSKSPYRDISVEKIEEYRRKDLSILEYSLQNPDLGVFVAEDLNGEFLGHVIAMANYIESSTGEPQGYIFDISVKEEYQGLGIGKNLMKTAEEFLQMAGMKYVGLNVTSSNEKAVKFYESLNYKEERKRMVKVLKN